MQIVNNEIVRMSAETILTKVRMISRQIGVGMYK